LGNSKKILVIDDEAPVRRILELKLKSRGFDVITAADGEQGLVLIESEKPDAVISDVNMPRLDGRKLCEMTDPMKAERPFLTLIVTGSVSPDEQQWIEDMQDTQFMEKPFSPAKILDAISQYFGG